MAESTPSSPVAEEVRANLVQIVQLLREPLPLGEEARRSLAEVVAELERALEAGHVPPAEMDHLKDSTTHVLEALRQHPDTGVLPAVRDRLTETFAAAEAQAPFAAGVARRLLEALSNIGI
jgi:hypothetical protein